MATTIRAIDVRGGKRYGVFEYGVDDHRYEGAVVVAIDRRVGDRIALRYDPTAPGRSWEDGDDPPGTDDWTFGPFGIAPGIFLIVAYRHQRGLKRFLDRRTGLGPAPT